MRVGAVVRVLCAAAQTTTAATLYYRRVIPVIPNVLFQLGRIVVGAAFIAAPERAGQGWVGEAAHSGGGVIARAFGIRDVALGTAGLLAARDRRALTGLLALGVIVDGVDCAATLAAGDQIPQRSRNAAAAVAAGAVLNGLGLIVSSRRGD